MPDHHDAALDALARALDALLVALVALDGLDGVDVPVDALDLALAGDDDYQAARVEFREVHAVLEDLIADDMVFFEVEAKVHALANATADVGFRLGISMAAQLLS